MHLAPPLGVTPFKFRTDRWHHKTQVPGLSCGVILGLAVSIEHRLVTDGRTDTMNHRASVESRGKNFLAAKPLPNRGEGLSYPCLATISPQPPPKKPVVSSR